VDDPTPSETPSPPSLSPVLSDIHASERALCLNNTAIVFAKVEDAQDDISSVALNTRFVRDGGGDDLFSMPGMSRSGNTDTFTTTLDGRNYTGTGTLHYSVTATDKAGHSTTSTSYTIPVERC